MSRSSKASTIAEKPHKPEVKHLLRASDADHPARPTTEFVDKDAKQLHLAVPLKDVYIKCPRTVGDFDSGSEDTPRAALFRNLLHLFVTAIGTVADNPNDSHEPLREKPRKRVVSYVTAVPKADLTETVALLFSFFVVPDPPLPDEDALAAAAAAGEGEAEEDNDPAGRGRGRRRKKNKKERELEEAERKKRDFVEVFYDSLCNAWDYAKTKAGGFKPRSQAELHPDTWTLSCKHPRIGLANYVHACASYCGPGAFDAGIALGDLRRNDNPFNPFKVFSLRRAVRILAEEDALSFFCHPRAVGYGWNGVDFDMKLPDETAALVERADRAARVGGADVFLYRFPVHGIYTYRIHARDIVQQSLFNRMLPHVKRPEIDREDVTFKRLYQSYLETLVNELPADADLESLAAEYAWRDAVNEKTFAGLISDLDDFAANHERRIKTARALAYELAAARIKHERLLLVRELRPIGGAGAEEAKLSQAQLKAIEERDGKIAECERKVLALRRAAAFFCDHKYTGPVTTRLAEVAGLVRREPRLLYNDEYWGTIIPAIAIHYCAAAEDVVNQRALDDLEGILRPDNDNIPDALKAVLTWEQQWRTDGKPGNFHLPYDLVYSNLSSFGEAIVRILIAEETVHQQYSSHVESLLVRLAALSVWFPFKMVLNVIFSAAHAQGKSYISQRLQAIMIAGTWLDTQDESTKALLGEDSLATHLMVTFKDELNAETTGQIDMRDKSEGAQYASNSGISQSNRRAQMTSGEVASVRLYKMPDGSYKTKTNRLKCRQSNIGNANVPVSRMAPNTTDRYLAVDLQLRMRDDMSRVERIHGPKSHLAPIFAPKDKDRFQRLQWFCALVGTLIECGVLHAPDNKLLGELVVKVMSAAQELGLRGADNQREIERVKIIANMLNMIWVSWLFFDSPLSPVKDQERVTIRDLLKVQPFLIVNMEAVVFALWVLYPSFSDTTHGFIIDKLNQKFGKARDIADILDQKAGGEAGDVNPADAGAELRNATLDLETADENLASIRRVCDKWAALNVGTATQQELDAVLTEENLEFPNFTAAKEYRDHKQNLYKTILERRDSRLRIAILAKASIYEDEAGLRDELAKLLKRKGDIVQSIPVAAARNLSKQQRQARKDAKADIERLDRVIDVVKKALHRLAPPAHQTDMRRFGTDAYYTFQWQPRARSNRYTGNPRELTHDDLVSDLAKQLSNTALRNKGDTVPSPALIESALRHLTTQVGFTSNDGREHTFINLTADKIQVARRLMEDDKDNQFVDIIRRVCMEPFFDRCNFITGAPEPKFPFIMETWSNSVLHMSPEQARKFLAHKTYGELAARRALIEAKADHKTWTAVEDEKARLSELGLSYRDIPGQFNFRTISNPSYIMKSVLDASIEKPMDAKEAAAVSIAMHPTPGIDNAHSSVNVNASQRVFSEYVKNTNYTMTRLLDVYPGRLPQEIRDIFLPHRREPLLKRLGASPNAQAYPDCFETRNAAFMEKSRAAAAREPEKYGLGAANQFHEMIFDDTQPLDGLLGLIDSGAFGGHTQQAVLVRAASSLLGVEADPDQKDGKEAAAAAHAHHQEEPAVGVDEGAEDATNEMLDLAALLDAEAEAKLDGRGEGDEGEEPGEEGGSGEGKGDGDDDDDGRPDAQLQAGIAASLQEHHPQASAPSSSFAAAPPNSFAAAISLGGRSSNPACAPLPPLPPAPVAAAAAAPEGKRNTSRLIIAGPVRTQMTLAESLVAAAAQQQAQLSAGSKRKRQASRSASPGDGRKRSRTEAKTSRELADEHDADDDDDGEPDEYDKSDPFLASEGEEEEDEELRRAAAVGKLREAIQRRTRQLSDEDPTDKPVYAEDFDEDADEDSDDAFSKKGMRRAREETKIQVRRLKRASKVVDIEGRDDAGDSDDGEYDDDEEDEPDAAPAQIEGQRSPSPPPAVDGEGGEEEEEEELPPPEEEEEEEAPSSAAVADGSGVAPMDEGEEGGEGETAAMEEGEGEGEADQAAAAAAAATVPMEEEEEEEPAPSVGKLPTSFSSDDDDEATRAAVTYTDPACRGHPVDTGGDDPSFQPGNLEYALMLEEQRGADHSGLFGARDEEEEEKDGLA